MNSLGYYQQVTDEEQRHQNIYFSSGSQYKIDSHLQSIQGSSDFYVQLINTNQRKGYKGSNNEHRVEDVWLEGEQGQTHVGEDEVLCQEVQQLKQLMGKRQTTNMLWINI